MGKLPAILIGLILLWVAWDVFQNGPQRALGGLFSLLSQPQYGQADRRTRSGDLAEGALRDTDDAPPRRAADD